mmetsp:Transcript_84116/g.271207  ORF Transcript_84116/g.271207 Transcript_84116/m.271207 type:complete len:406 (-) Transcript_84116:301-1518(-)
MLDIIASHGALTSIMKFLHPLQLSEEERKDILARYYEKDSDGRFRFTFADGYGGLLLEEERDLVEANDEHFRWSARRPRLLEQIRSMKADILSLVELDHFFDFRENLSDTYEAAFTKRPRALSSDGSSIFWRKQRFELLRPPINITFEDWEPRQGEVHHQDRVMLAVALRDRSPGGMGRRLVAASVHLMRNPEDTGKDAMRMLEVSQMMRALSCFVAEVGAEGLVVMGDFNAVPQSWTHLFALHGWQDCIGSEKGMQDAFDDVEWGPREEACTTRTGARSVWVDYIFFSSRTMFLESRPEVERCPKLPIPDAEHPSDHLPIVATLRFRPTAVPLDQRSRGPEEASCAGSEAARSAGRVGFVAQTASPAVESSPLRGPSQPGSCGSSPPLSIRDHTPGTHTAVHAD